MENESLRNQVISKIEDYKKTILSDFNISLCRIYSTHNFTSLGNITKPMIEIEFKESPEEPTWFFLLRADTKTINELFDVLDFICFFNQRIKETKEFIVNNLKLTDRSLEFRNRVFIGRGKRTFLVKFLYIGFQLAPRNNKLYPLEFFLGQYSLNGKKHGVYMSLNEKSNRLDILPSKLKVNFRFKPYLNLTKNEFSIKELKDILFYEREDLKGLDLKEKIIHLYCDKDP